MTSIETTQTKGRSRNNPTGRGKERIAGQSDRQYRIDRDVYTSGQVARLLSIPDRTLRRYLAIGRIAGSQHPITGTWEISRFALARFIEQSGCTAVHVSQQVHISIVSDEPTMGGLFRQGVIEKIPNSRIQILDDVCTALIYIGNACPDLVILKANMPILSGREILSAIRNNPITAHVKVIALSDQPEEIAELKAIGADVALQMPFSYQDLTDKIQELLTRNVPESSDTIGLA
ncbi:MAG: response regulator [Myxococcota bacterium]|nr:response regulator [Myxococcota bacterium]